jgi:hypothetical protein
MGEKMEREVGVGEGGIIGIITLHGQKKETFFINITTLYVDK